MTATVLATIGWAAAGGLLAWLLRMHRQLIEARVSEHAAVEIMADAEKDKKDLRARLNATIVNLRTKSSEDAAKHRAEVGLVWNQVRVIYKAWEEEFAAHGITLTEEAKRRLRDRMGSPLRFLLSNQAGSSDKAGGAVPDGAPAPHAGVDPDRDDGH